MTSTDALTPDAWRAAIGASGAHPSTRLVCHAIAAHLVDGVASMSTTVLAAETGLARTTVEQHIARALAIGLIEVAGRTRTGRRFRPARPAAPLPPKPQRKARGGRRRMPRPEPLPDLPPLPPAGLLVDIRDPRWHAWITHGLSRDEMSTWAATARRTREAIVIPAHWPEPSAAVEPPSALGVVTIPAGTPEHAAWLCHMRRTGRAAQATAADVSKRTLVEKSRWPEVPRG